MRKRYYILFIISRLAEEEKEKEKEREEKEKKVMWVEVFN